MNKKFLPLIVIAIIILIGGVFVWSKNKNNQPSDTTGLIYFYGQGCSHCAKVDEYIVTNKVKEKIDFDEREVFFNRNNAVLLSELAKKCGLNENEIGVPFFWDGSKCIVGDADIINFFKEKISGS